jgi:hypothetical protein
MVTDKKSNPNPFIRMAQEAASKQTGGLPVATGKAHKKTTAPKPTQGYGGKVMRKTGRGG